VVSEKYKTGIRVPWVKKYRFIFLVVAVFLLSVYYFSLPPRLFQDPFSTVLEDRNGKLLGALIASDGQWRFPEGGAVPEKFREALILFEDKRFEHHPGVDVLALARAVRQNIRAGKIVSGGSTLTMQVIRLSRKNQSRTFFGKVIEIILATRLEWRYSKNEILSFYAAHAPFGGNVVGLEAACWRYFNSDVSQMSWSDAALLAVLPNNPSLIHPGKNREQLKIKRDRLLSKLLQLGKMDSLTFALSMAEPLPGAPHALPRMAPHLLQRLVKEGYQEQRIISTVDIDLQERVQQIVGRHHQLLKAKQVFNMAALVVEVKTGSVLAYIGNTPAGSDHGEAVDIVMARRSTGSILKPFLFAAMLDDGKLLPAMLVPDIPTAINGFVPKNFSKQYDGAVSASEALIRSLNIPAVHELIAYRYERFYELLKNIGITTLHQPAGHYGLSLILGGAEGTLWDITGAYASMARTLNNYFEMPGTNRYHRSDFHPPVYRTSNEKITPADESSSWLSAASIYLTMDALQEVYRPGEETGWRHFYSAKQIAWKTGTSHGLRDAWAVGVNGDYAVGVWVGNADGEGRPGLTGTEAAAPVMFDVFSVLPGNTWFQVPQSELNTVEVCSRSGLRATELCEAKTEMLVTKPAMQSGACRYHKSVHLSADGRYRVHADCEAVSSMKVQPWFVLPPVQEYFFKAKNLSYRPLPPLRSDCTNPASVASMELIYPRPEAKIFIPRELDGTQGSALFEVVHRNKATTVYWHLDDTYVNATRGTHRLQLSPPPGEHKITLVDEQGEMLERKFWVGR
jgi:penicillin-binding protein 1C